MLRIPVALAAAMLLVPVAWAGVQTQSVEYAAGDVRCKGFLAYDDAVQGPRPAVLIVHEWWGLGKHPRQVAHDLAALGYTALAIDMYGEGKLTTDPKQAAEWSGQCKENPALARARFEAALDFVRKDSRADPRRVAAIGYCFGGTVVLEMARAGVDLAGVVSFHGGLKSMLDAPQTPMRSRVLVCHGADDPFVPAAEVTAFQDEMRRCGADWQFVAYGGAQHSFTNPEANGAIPGAQYEANAARRSWEHMKTFLVECFE